MSPFTPLHIFIMIASLLIGFYLGYKSQEINNQSGARSKLNNQSGARS